MSLKKTYENKMQAQLNELKVEIDDLRKKAEQAEINLQLEFFTLLDELQEKLDLANHSLQRLKQSSEEEWEEFKKEFELIWKSLRELVITVISP